MTSDNTWEEITKVSGNHLIELIAVPLIALFLGLLKLLDVYIQKGFNRKLESIYEERTSPDAVVRARCYVKEAFFEEPGVAQVYNGALYVFTLTGRKIQVPLEKVTLTKFRRNNILGRYPWWRKSMFKLDTPETAGLVLGVTDPEPWLEVFKTR
jgi:hypothetical protein